MPGTAAQAPAVDPPKHPVYALTTSELAQYRKQLQSAIAYFDKQSPVPAVRTDLQAALDAVLDEQEQRAKLADA